MRGSRVELWVFDRSGIFCSKAFDLQNDFAEFLPIALSYQHMTDQNLGKSNIFETGDDVKYCKELETTANLRRSLRWGTQRKFLTPSVGDKQNKNEENLRETTSSINGFLQYTKETTNFFQNRILICTITSPLGRPLCSFQSLVELLQVLRDAIMCHRSLYYDARLLHRDISPGNIIILDHQDKEQPKGLLIDLDSAISLDEASEAELGITGTRPFMAIGVLRNEPYTCRHDLESFFYVLIWMIITDDTESPPEGSRLRRWSNGDWDSLAAHKTLDMTDEQF
ncbi:hypothetical protein BB8028_0008g00270 [Beauveria bassiana]|uniref:Protein kinase domain-containing protein n=1 Tax=Beauveria bassiana TaxID=176275 RepID=A0A2S7YMV3_BEABA|nr:hypothetical protein BB8028_0008g00270 [Beauveria bassiana]